MSSCPTNGTYSARAAGTTMTAHMSILSLDLYVALRVDGCVNDFAEALMP